MADLWPSARRGNGSNGSRAPSSRPSVPNCVRFTPIEAGEAQAVRGSGLGSGIAMAIIVRHGGTVSYDSPLPGGGRRFWIRLARLQSGPKGSQPARALLEELEDDR